MTAPLSPTSLAHSFNQRLAVPSASSALLGIPGLGAHADSFSQTLQRQMNTPVRPPGQASARPAEREPEPSRPTPASQTPAQRPAEPAREPGRSTEARTTQDGATDKPAGTSTQPDQKAADGSTAENKTDASSPADQRPDATTAQGEAAAAAAGNSASGVGTGVPDAETLVLQAAGTAETVVDAPEAAALAGLPAALAALMAGTKQAGTDGGETAPTLTATTGGRKDPQDARSLPNSAFLAKAETSAGGADRSPAFMVQGRALAAGVLADKGMAAAQALKAVAGEAGAAGTQQPNAFLSTHAPMHLLRHAPATQPATPQLPVQTPAGQQAWAEDVGNQVRWMLGRAESKAELVLTPPNLGKLEVSINLNGDQTTAQFVASSQAAREALERAMPQLREILQQAGISLGEANVSTSDQGAREDGGTAGRGRSDAVGNAGSEGGIAGGGTASGWIRQHDGMVDTFA